MSAFAPVIERVNPEGLGLLETYGGLDLDYINERYRIYDPELGRLVEKPWTDIVNNRSLPAGRTYWDQNGVLQTAAADSPVIEYDPVTGAKLGNRIWGSYANTIPASQNFLNSNWSFNSLDVDIISAAHPGLNATPAQRFIIKATNSNHILFSQPTSLNYQSGKTYVLTWVIKPAGYSWAQLVVASAKFGTNVWANFNVTTGTFGATGSSVIGRWAKPLPDGYYEITITAVATASGVDTNGGIQALPSDLPTRLPSYTGDGVSGLYLWHTQIGEGAAPLPYVLTATTAVTIPAESQIIDGQNFLDLWNSGEGSVFCLASASNKFGYMFQVDSGSLLHRRLLRFDDLSGLRAFSIKDAAVASATAGTTWVAGVSKRGATNFVRGVYCRASAEGSISGFGDNAPDGANRLSIGHSPFGGATWLEGHIRRLIVLRKALPDSLLQRITQP